MKGGKGLRRKYSMVIATNLSVASIRRKLLKMTHSLEERSVYTNSESCTCNT